MFDTATCTEAVERWAAWQRDAQMHPGGFGHLPDSAGPGLAGALDMWEPGTRTDLDHTIAYPAGPTADYNLTGLCRHHHRLKQHPRWQASLTPEARMTWTTPTGHTHTTDPPTPVEPADPPPF